MVSTLGPFRMLAHRFELVVEHGPLADWCSRAFAPLRSDGPTSVTYTIARSEGARFDLLADAVTHGRGLAPAAVLPLLMADLNRRAARSTRDHLVLHAAVVGVEGGVVLLVTRSGGGKSTLAATGARHGHAYGGDEHGALRLEDGLVEPVPKPLALKHGSVGLFPDLVPPPESPVSPFMAEQLVVAPEALGGEVLTAPAPVRAIVLPEFRPGAVVEVARLRPAEALMTLRAHAFNFATDPPASFRTLSSVVRRIPLQSVTYGEQSDAWTAIWGHVAWP